jgi:hypothetical protein
MRSRPTLLRSLRASFRELQPVEFPRFGAAVAWRLENLVCVLIGHVKLADVDDELLRGFATVLRRPSPQVSYKTTIGKPFEIDITEADPWPFHVSLYAWGAQTRSSCKSAHPASRPS